MQTKLNTLSQPVQDGGQLEKPSGLEGAETGELLARIAAMMPSLSKSDVKIAGYLLDGPKDFFRASVRSVAAEVAVSEPTVVRFCRTVGCEGFRDLKFQIIQEMAFQQAQRDSAPPMAEASAFATADHDSDEGMISERVYERALQALTTAHAQIDVRGLREAAQAIARAERITIYGVGGSSAILAQEMHNRLFRLGLSAMAFVDTYAQCMSAATLTKNDVAIFISSTGRPRVLNDSLELAKHYGATCIAITDSENLLGRESDICINVRLSLSDVSEFQPNPMRFAQLMAIDTLAFCVATTLGPRARNALRKARASVVSLHGMAPQQPIGD